MTQPFTRADVHLGQVLTVPDDQFTRGGESGQVIDIFDDGVTLDFFRCFCGGTRCACYISIEYWSFKELGIDP